MFTVDLSSYLKQKGGQQPPNPSQTALPPMPQMQQGGNEPIPGFDVDPDLMMNPSGMPSITPMSTSDSSGYVKDLMRMDDFLDYLYHLLHGDVLIERDGEKNWHENKKPPGESGGPIATPAGIRIILSKVGHFLSKFTSHGALTVEQAHGYAYEAASESLYFCILEGEDYKIRRDKWCQIVLMVDEIVYTNLTRTVNAYESKRIASIHKGFEYSGMGPSPEVNPSFMNKFPGIT